MNLNIVYVRCLSVFYSTFIISLLYFRDRQEKRFNESQTPLSTNTTGPPTTHAHYRAVSSTVVAGQDDYLQPNTNTHGQKPAAKADEPLIHIWETPLPDPNNESAVVPSGGCTIHRGQKEHNVTAGSQPATTTKDVNRTGTSYYSPNTGHKYYVLDK